MDVRHSAFLNILGAGLTGTAPSVDATLTAEDYAAMAKLAGQQHVLPLFYEVAYRIPAAAQALQPLGAAVRRQVMEQALRTQRFLALEQRMLSAGLTPLVAKGIVCRGLYPQPDHRPSADEDLLIPADQFAPCAQLLEGEGLTTGESADGFECAFRSGGRFCIELHRQFFDPAAAYGGWNRFFDRVFDRAVEIEVQGQKLLTMAPTDHILYLLLHAFKHFLHSGFGIRQVCDIALFAGTYGDAIDWAYVRAALGQVRAERFAGAVLRIGKKHLGIPGPGAFDDLAVEEMPLLEDLLAGGVYGGATESRKRSSNVTLAAYAHKKKGVLGSALFPPVSSLQGRYPYLKNRPWLLPWAWLCRLATYKQSRQAAETVKIGNQRLELLRLYGVTEECD